jgi:hypothetical protein
LRRRPSSELTAPDASSAIAAAAAAAAERALWPLAAYYPAGPVDSCMLRAGG